MQNFDSRPKFLQLLKNWLCARFRIDPKTFWDFPPEMPFFQLHSVRSSLTYIPSIFLILVLLITCCSWDQLRVDLSFEGFNYYFFQVLKFPLAFLALLIPLIAIFAANHRSVQAKETMRLTREQNVFANYYKHREEFAKYVSSLDFNIAINPIALHFSLFDKKSLSFNEEFIGVFGRQLSLMIEYLDCLWETDCKLNKRDFMGCKKRILASISFYVDFSVSGVTPENYYLKVLPIGDAEAASELIVEAGVRDYQWYLENINIIFCFLFFFKKVFLFSFEEYQAALKGRYEIIEGLIEFSNNNPSMPYFDSENGYSFN